MNNMEQKVKVAFDLKNTDSSVPFETTWAEEVEKGKYKLLNSLFYAYGFSFGDVVSATENEEGQLIVGGAQDRGGHSTYRVFLSPETTPEVFEKYCNQIQALGCTYEQGTKSLYAIDVPSAVDVKKEYQLLEEGEKGGVWEFEEAHYYSEG